MFVRVWVAVSRAHQQSTAVYGCIRLYTAVYHVIIHYPNLRRFMQRFAPLHCVVARTTSRIPSNPPLISIPITHDYVYALSTPLRIRRQTYASFPSYSSPPIGTKWNKRLRKLGVAVVVGAGALWLDAEYNARTLTRNFRTVWYGAAIALDYKFVLFCYDTSLVRYAH